MGVHVKVFLLLLDEILIAGGVVFLLRKLGVEIPFWVYVMIGVACAALYVVLHRLL